MPGGAALLAAQTGAALVPTVCQFTERGWRLVVLPGGPGRRPRPAQGPGGAARCSRSPTPSPTSIAAQPEDWHMLGRIWADVPPDPRGRVAPDAHRPGLPLPVGRPRRGPVPRPRPGRDAARPGPPRRGAHARRARGVARRRSAITFAGRTVPIPYNGSMASLQFGPVSAARVRRWLRDGHFDVVHVHEPAPPSVSLLVCMIAKGPIVATFHTATVRSKWLAAWGPVVRPWLERISGRIAVSDFARRVQVEHLGGDAVIIPNGVHVAAFADGPVAARLTPRRRRPDDRLPRPLRRAAQGPAGAARGHAHRRPPAPRRPAADRRPRRRRRRPRADRRGPARRTSACSAS